MKESSFATLEDLLENESFRRWVLEGDDETEVVWEDWSQQHPEKQVLVNKAVLILQGLPFDLASKPSNPHLTKDAWKKLQERRGEQTQPVTIRQARTTNRRRRLHPWKWAVAASITALICFLQFYVINPKVVHRTPFGQQRSVVLPDGTTVELNANSSLTYRKRRPRKVWLDGEAFFKVTKQLTTGARFLVLTNDLTVEVLGTAFNVIEKERETEVVLEEGSVKLKLKRDFEPELMMTPGELVTFSTETSETLKQKQVVTHPLTSWKDGVLVFEDAPLMEVFQRIEAVYGWRAVYYDEALKTRKVSIGLPADDLESGLLMLRKAIGLEIEKVQKGGDVLLLR